MTEKRGLWRTLVNKTYSLRLPGTHHKQLSQTGYRPVGSGCSREVILQKILYAPLITVSDLPFEIGPLALILLRITAVKISLFANLFMEDQRGTRV